MTCIVGIDPGLSGACAILTDAGEFVEVFDLPVMEVGGKDAFVKRVVNARAFQAQLRQRLTRYVALIAFVEAVGAMPKQGRSSIMSLGHTLGTIESVLACVGIPFLKVRPQDWKPYFSLKNPKVQVLDKETGKMVAKSKKDAGQSRAYAIRRFPSSADSLDLAKHHNRAEAILIGYYGCQRMKPAHYTEEGDILGHETRIEH